MSKFILSIIALSFLSLSMGQVLTDSPCITVVNNTISDFEKLMTDIKNKDDTQVLLDAYKIYNDITSAKQECSDCIQELEYTWDGLEKVFNDIVAGNFSLLENDAETMGKFLLEAIAYCKMSDPPMFQLQKNGLSFTLSDDCNSEFQSLNSTADAIKADCQARNLVQLQKDITQIQSEASNSKSSCAQCVSAIQVGINNTNTILDSAKAANWILALANSYALIENIAEAESQCAKNIMINAAPNCEGDIENVITDAHNLIDGIKQKNGTAAIIDLEQLIDDIDYAKLDCPICGKEIDTEVIDLKSIVTDIKAKDWIKAITAGTAAYNELQVVKEKCI